MAGCLSETLLEPWLYLMGGLLLLVDKVIAQDSEGSIHGSGACTQLDFLADGVVCFLESSFGQGGDGKQQNTDSQSSSVILV